jgi:hypothetical protein
VAQVVQIECTSDITGAAAAEQHAITVDGVAYEIDVTGAEFDERFGAVVDLLREHGRVVKPARGTRGKGTAKRQAAAADDDAKARRAWLRSEGHDVSDRGRIPSELNTLYDAAH